MRTALLPVILAAAAVCAAAAQPGPKPTIQPFFSTIADGPAFYVSCRNETSSALSSGDIRWTSSLRLDGEPISESSGRIGPGLSVMVQPGETWYGIVVLRQSNTGYFPAVKFGALIRRSPVVPLSDGRHKLAVLCGETWSDEHEFYWEADDRVARE